MRRRGGAWIAGVIALGACTPSASSGPATASASASATASATASASGFGSLRGCPWAGTKHASVRDVDFCACDHRFVGPLAGCRAEHRIYTASGGGGHYTTELFLLTAFADVDGDGSDEALVVLRELDMAPTDVNAREHAELMVFAVRSGALVLVASGASGKVVSAAAHGRGFTLEERGATKECDVEYAVRGATIEPTSARCP